MGATGVAAHKVKEETGFNVHYGPVRASDLKRFIGDGYRADKEMRRVTFDFSDRAKLIPNDFMYGKYYLLGAMAIVFLISGISRSGLSYKNFSIEVGPVLLNVFLAYLSGIVINSYVSSVYSCQSFLIKRFLSRVIDLFSTFIIRAYR